MTFDPDGIEHENWRLTKVCFGKNEAATLAGERRAADDASDETGSERCRASRALAEGS